MNYKKIKLPAMLGLFGMLNTAAYSQIYMCQPCPAGTYQSGNSCVSCPSGVSSKPGSASSAACNIFNGSYTIEKTIVDFNGYGYKEGVLEPGLYLAILGGSNGTYADDLSPDSKQEAEGWRHRQWEGTRGGRLQYIFYRSEPSWYEIYSSPAEKNPDARGPCYKEVKETVGGGTSWKTVFDEERWNKDPSQCSGHGSTGSSAYLQAYAGNENSGEPDIDLVAGGGAGSLNYIFNICKNFEKRVSDGYGDNYDGSNVAGGKGGWISRDRIIDPTMNYTTKSESFKCPGYSSTLSYRYYIADSEPGRTSPESNTTQFTDKLCENCAKLYKLK